MRKDWDRDFIADGPAKQITPRWKSPPAGKLSKNLLSSGQPALEVARLFK